MITPTKADRPLEQMVVVNNMKNAQCDAASVVSNFEYEEYVYPLLTGLLVVSLLLNFYFIIKAAIQRFSVRKKQFEDKEVNVDNVILDPTIVNKKIRFAKHGTVYHFQQDCHHS